MGMDALERLFEDAKNSSKNQGSQYSVEEQLDVDDDFLGVMSNSSKDTLFSRLQKADSDDINLKEEPIADPTDLKNFNDDIKSALDYNLVNESTEESKKEIKTEDELLFGKVELDNIEEDEIDNEEEELTTEDEEIKEEPEEPVVEHKRGRGRPRKKPLEESDSIKTSEHVIQKATVNTNSTEDIKSLNDFMDSLAKDLINELRESNYRTRNFNKKQMNVILDYLENKI